MTERKIDPQPVYASDADEEFYEIPPVPIGVDTHTHLFPEAMFRAIRMWFRRAGWMIPYPARADEVIALAKRFRVGEMWALPYAHKAGIACELNRWMGALQRRHTMVRGFSTVHPADHDPGGVVEEALDVHGLWGIKLHAEVQDVAVDDRRLDGAFDIVEARAKVAVVHSGDAPYPAPKPNMRVECVARRLERNPDLKVVVAHLGTWETDRYLALLNDFSGLYLDVSFTRYPGAPGDPRLQFDSLVPYADRILFGSDFPNITFPYAGQVKRWLELDWVRERREAFFGGTARRLLEGVSADPH